MEKDIELLINTESQYGNDKKNASLFCEYGSAS